MPLIATDLRTLSRLLDEAMDLDPEQVEPWLNAIPEVHIHFCPWLRDMLSARRANGDSGFLADGPRLSGDPVDETLSHAGDLIGAYRLIREIGRGGMGTVWLAERADGSFRRRVAIKLPRLVWGAGLAARMARERDIGALLEHPNIARLYDAGVDDKGRPFLALEYVDGLPLDSWCEAQRLSVPDLLRLFLQVARAVAYAHARLVVHRDIKPSNVLVTADGQAHLLDFGIAKLLIETEAGDDQLTRDQGRVLTPRNASPEQLSGGTITVASDVYLLGTLLYGMLTGTHPHTVKRKTAAAFEEAILEGEAALASHRAAGPATARRLRGDIDSILAKALKRAPEDRYATVDAMVADIERYLDGERVLARPDGLGYRLGKVVRRHYLPFIAAGAVLAALLGGAGLALAQAQRANAEAERARVVKEFVVDMFNTQVGPDGAVGQMPGIALLERGARMIDPKFGGQPLLQAELYGVVSTMFHNLADMDQAANYATRQVETLSAARAPVSEIARATLRLADIFIPMLRNDDALMRAQRVLDLAGDNKSLQASAHALKAKALLFGYADTERAGLELDAAETAAHEGGASKSDRAELALARGIWFSFRKMPEEARVRFDEAIAMGLAAEGPMSIHALYGRQEAAKTLLMAGRFDGGKSYLAAALATLRAAGGPDDVRAATWEAYGANWMLKGEGITFAQAMQTYERSLASMRAQKWAVPRSAMADIELRMGLACLLWGDVERGSRLAVSAEEETLTSPDPVSQWWRRVNLIRALAPSGRAEEAVGLAREMLTLREGWATVDLRYTYKLIALALVHARRYSEAEAVLAEYDAKSNVAQARAPAESPPFSLEEVRMLVALENSKPHAVLDLTAHLPPMKSVHDNEIAWLSRGSALCQTGLSDEGLKLLSQWLPRLATDRYEASPEVAYWRARMGLCALQAGQRQRAVEASQLASAALAAQPTVSLHYKAQVRELERRLHRS